MGGADAQLGPRRSVGGACGALRGMKGKRVCRLRNGYRWILLAGIRKGTWKPAAESPQTGWIGQPKAKRRTRTRTRHRRRLGAPGLGGAGAAKPAVSARGVGRSRSLGLGCVHRAEAGAEGRRDQLPRRLGPWVNKGGG